MEMYICSHCGNIITYLEKTAVPVSCCGQIMQKLEPNTVDAAKEKHVPIYKIEGATVTVDVGEVTHPMQEDHYIKWIIVETCCGYHLKNLLPTDEPKAVFNLTEKEKVLAVYEFCNKHGVWKT